ncbi:hypothetical protein [Maribacter sp. HTCC2170]|uniref:hypothetical protein n=1 Tax=Maribacter sp. (strain HTCC2170 / KCCM 42371) TaxID=313603 RepID=UPI00006B216D|nr:hypothetical protein [Maribacter sp. HTCC2170]EAR00185.1 hypothetical protein FB2170_00925 [Maribacter sp. HTCC2170]
MIVWSGRGFLSVIVLIAALFASISLLPKHLADYGFVIATFTAGIFSWYFGHKWNTANAMTVIDEKTGEKFLLKNNNSLFWIKMEYWGPIFLVLGIVILFQNSLNAAIVASILLISFTAYRFSSKKKDLNNVKNANLVVERRQNDESAIASNREVIELNPDREKMRVTKEDPNRFMPK